MPEGADVVFRQKQESFRGGGHAVGDSVRSPSVCQHVGRLQNPGAPAVLEEVGFEVKQPALGYPAMEQSSEVRNRRLS